eukprot:CAMPEP_0175137980 /NCGR_PEP_ID=MMETSP0087-20121206/10098_1 /TAXON_ID=136419 /ORGANISM="Unknown Unknown, Strain D1" /LENGTH=214 /DNA_ID=CAMNT_0016420839 /DNA_START=9 /DNA_END=650 /DNA_ORIENTATION=-
MSDEKCGFCSKVLPAEGSRCKCSRCKAVYYCDRECQRKHWKVHKATCIPPQATNTSGSEHKEQKSAYTGEVHSIEQANGFRCQPEQMFRALTDANMVKGYTQAETQIDCKVGGRFSLFGGTTTGEFVALESPNKIVQKWRFKDWPDNHFSDVVITLEASNETTCIVKLTQTNIPDVNKFGMHSQKETVEQGWNQFFWERIQKMVGYHKVDKSEW